MNNDHSQSSTLTGFFSRLLGDDERPAPLAAGHPLAGLLRTDRVSSTKPRPGHPADVILPSKPKSPEQRQTGIDVDAVRLHGSSGTARDLAVASDVRSDRLPASDCVTAGATGPHGSIPGRTPRPAAGSRRIP